MQRGKWHKYFVCLIVSKSSTVKKKCRNQQQDSRIFQRICNFNLLMHKSIMIMKGLYTGIQVKVTSKFIETVIYIYRAHIIKNLIQQELGILTPEHLVIDMFRYKHFVRFDLMNVEIFIYIYLQPDEIKLSLQIKKTPNFLNPKNYIKCIFMSWV